MRTTWLTSKFGGAVAGSVIELEEGRYAGDFTINADGTSTQPIIVRAKRGARAYIDGSLIVNGDYVILDNVEVMYSGWTSRVSAESVSSPSDIPTNKVLTINGDYVQLIHCHIHDLAVIASNGQGVRWYACHIHNNGWDAPDRGHGHGIYVQNNGAEVIIEYCLIHDNCGWGVHGYTEGGHINNITVRFNVCFNNGSPALSGANNILIGGEVIASNPKAQSNDSYGADGINIGYDAGADGTIIVTDNYTPDGLVMNFTGGTVSGNVTSAPGSGSRITVRPNAELLRTGSLSIYNWDNANSVVVDVSSILAAGANYTLRYMQNDRNDVVSGTVALNGTITVDMRASVHSVAPLIGGSGMAGVLTAPAYGCFEIEG